MTNPTGNEGIARCMHQVPSNWPCADCKISDLHAELAEKEAEVRGLEAERDALAVMVGELRKALESDLECWGMVSADLTRLDQQNHKVPFIELIDPMKDIRKALSLTLPASVEKVAKMRRLIQTAIEVHKRTAVGGDMEDRAVHDYLDDDVFALNSDEGGGTTKPEEGG